MRKSVCYVIVLFLTAACPETNLAPKARLGAALKGVTHSYELRSHLSFCRFLDGMVSFRAPRVC